MKKTYNKCPYVLIWCTSFLFFIYVQNKKYLYHIFKRSKWFEHFMKLPSKSCLSKWKLNGKGNNTTYTQGKHICISFNILVIKITFIYLYVDSILYSLLYLVKSFSFFSVLKEKVNLKFEKLSKLFQCKLFLTKSF